MKNLALKKQVVPSTSGGKPIAVTVSYAKIDTVTGALELKFKPGKMPFNIVMKSER